MPKEPRRKFKGGDKPYHKKRSQVSQNDQTSSTSSLKSRIRNLRRLLDHIDNDPDNRMPANVRIERERELETCEHELAEKQATEREAQFRNKIIGRYHHIRFFERQKATRILKKVTKKLEASEVQSERKDTLHKRHNAEVDVNYTIYYPLLKPYVSLYPKQKGETKDLNQQSPESVDGPKGDLDMWKAVEKAMEDGTLEALRESREGVTVPGSKVTKAHRDRGQKTKQDHKRAQKVKESKTASRDEQDEESDGGFFE